MPNSKPKLLVVKELPPEAMQRLSTDYDCIFTPVEHVPSLNALEGVKAVVTSGVIGLPAEYLAHLPQLELIASFGVGTDGLALDAYHDRGILVTNTPGVLVDDVADLAMGLILAALRRIPAMDAYVRDGQWARQGPAPLTTSLSGKTLGIVGLGSIGGAVAHRARAFRMKVGYAGPDAVEGYQRYPDVHSLAEASDVLLVSCPGGPATRGLIDARILEALGSEGWLVNISRGSIVDEDALLHALRQRTIMGAALDVFATEPDLHPAYASFDNVILSPHHASGTRETRDSMAKLLIDNLDAHFAGLPLLTPIHSPSTTR